MNNEDLISDVTPITLPNGVVVDNEVLRGTTDFRLTAFDEGSFVPPEEFALLLREDSLQAAEEARVRTLVDLLSINRAPQIFERQSLAQSLIRDPALNSTPGHSPVPTPSLVKKKVRHLKCRDGFYKIETVPLTWTTPAQVLHVPVRISNRRGISFNEVGLFPSDQMSSAIDLQFRLDRVVQKPYKKSSTEVVEHYYYEEL